MQSELRFDTGGMSMTRFRARLPTILASRYVRYVTGFGVAVGVGMAPFLGKYKIPMFDALLELFPKDSKLTLIPLSAFLMGLVAVAIQFYAGETIPPNTIRRRFTFGFAAILLAFVGLVTLYTPQRVLRIPDPSTGGREPIILGWSRLPKGGTCTCEPTESDLACVYALGLEDISLCWPSISQVQLSLHLLYLILTGGFGGLIGLLLLQEEARQQAKEEAQRQAGEKKKKAPKRVRKNGSEGPSTPKKKRATKAASADPDQPSNDTDTPEADRKLPEPEVLP